MTVSPTRHVVHDLKDLLLVLGFGVLLVLTALPVHPNRSPDAERAVFHAINSLPGAIYGPMWVVMQLGNLVVVPIAAAVVAAFRRFRLAAAILVAGVAKLYLARVVKSIVERDRPAAVIDDVTLRGDASATGQAYVSGHAVVAFALATLIGVYLPRRWALAGWGLAVAVCIGRVYVGAHLPLDVIGGAALGCAIGSTLNFVFGRPSRSSVAIGDTASND